jgi:hypothetical protein
MTFRRLFPVLLIIFSLPLSTSWADRVITKDGKTYKGKIMIDTDKAVLIGNPPFDPNSYLIQAEDIDTIVYEEYVPNTPAERKRGISGTLHLQSNAYSSKQLSVSPAVGLMLEGGFRFHPLIEIGGGFQWVPSLSASGDGLLMSDGTASRGYESFWMYTLDFTARLYPFYKKAKWKTEPYLVTGYGWSHLIPKASGDSLSGAGWILGFGALHPLTRNLFLDGRFAYQPLSYDKVKFLGQDANISPEVAEHQYTLSIGLSYRI